MTDLAQKYKRHTDIEHVLQKPEMYIGAIEPASKSILVYDDALGEVTSVTVDFHEGLYKIFDEALSNCYDHAVRTEASAHPVSVIKISIDSKEVSFFNDGEGIDVDVHPKEGIYIPELIFAHMRTSTNYGDEVNLGGGRHGLGVKLAFILSSRACLEVIDQTRKLSYTQEFQNNLDVVSKPFIKSIHRELKTGSTKISFEPDMARFNLESIPSYMESLLKKRAYDISIFLPSVKIYFNGKLLTKRAFKPYMSACFPRQKLALFETDNWKVAVCASENGFYQTSLVNGIQTFSGGTHVDTVVSKLTYILSSKLKERKKTSVSPKVIQTFLGLFVSCRSFNPAFRGQIKEALISNKFCEPFEPSSEFIEATYKLVAIKACTYSTAMDEIKKKKQDQKLLSSTDGAVSKMVLGVPELTDANWAGTRKSELCTLIICEGNSAGTGIISGLSENDRNIYGVYPVRGKIVNPLGKGATKIAQDKIIVDLKKVLGLEAGKTYSAPKGMRYGKVVFMTDQDLDGHHIKALGLNLFNTLWPSLLELKGVFGFIQTPILKARKGSKELSFYFERDYVEWRSTAQPEKWKIKYYKGLGTSTAKEFKEYFQNVRMVQFTLTDKCRQAFDMAFGKNVEARKMWLSNYDKNIGIEIVDNKVSYDDFINKELIHFSKYDCDRSIPSIDGLKISQRKILYTALSILKPGKEVKVAQFCGRVAEITHYHHGEVNLEKTVVGMAQDFVGSNNLNLLLPDGQFGSRRHGGTDSAASRYIYTQLNPITRFIYRKEDEAILEYLEDDGHSVEPRFYMPIVPMILVNGAMGIGTGFSCSVLPHKLLDLIEAVENMLQDYPIESPPPHFNGFKGAVAVSKPGYYSTTGVFSYDETKGVLKVTELPVGMWNIAFKELLEELVEKKVVKSFADTSTDTAVCFTVNLIRKEWDKDDIISTFKLRRSHSETNMYLFSFDDKLVKFNSPKDILDYYFPIRLNFYAKRKQHLIEELEQAILLAYNKYRYITSIIDGELEVFLPKTQVVSYLEANEYHKINDSFNYLLKMSIDNLCEDGACDLKERYDTLTENLETLKNTEPANIWLNELEELRAELTKAPI